MQKEIWTFKGTEDKSKSTKYTRLKYKVKYENKTKVICGISTKFTFILRVINCLICHINSYIKASVAKILDSGVAVNLKKRHRFRVLHQIDTMT